MGKQVRNAELGIARLLADGNRNRFAVRFYHDAVHRKGNRAPLVLADPAVIVGLQIRDLIFLKQRVGL